MSAIASCRVLCVAGSPRRDGNTDRLLAACAEGVAQAGGMTDLLLAADADVGPCRGCNACSRTGRCVIRDGMDDVDRRIDAADALVVASPVYFATVPSALKALYDRLQPYWARTQRLGEVRDRRRPGAFIAVGGGGDPFGLACAVTPTKSVFAVLGVDYTAELCVIGPDEPDDILAHHQELTRAAQIGALLVAEARARRTSL